MLSEDDESDTSEVQAPVPVPLVVLELLEGEMDAYFLKDSSRRKLQMSRLTDAAVYVLNERTKSWQSYEEMSLGIKEKSRQQQTREQLNALAAIAATSVHTMHCFTPCQSANTLGSSYWNTV